MSTKRRTKKKTATSKRRKRRIKNLDKYVLTAIIYIVGWSVAFFTAWIIFQQEPSVLEGCILTPGVVELLACAWIKSGKKNGTSQKSSYSADIGAEGVENESTEEINIP